MSRREQRKRRAKITAAARHMRYRAWVTGLVAAALERERKTKGPMKWCNTCHRTHRSHQTCNLYLRTITTKKGTKMKVWAH